MAATISDVNNWINNGKQMNVLYLVVMTDTFDYGDYPKFAFTEDELRILKESNNKNMQLIQEIIELKTPHKRRCGNMELKEHIG